MSSELATHTSQRKKIIGIAELHVSANPADVLVTYALGSCLGVAMHDPGMRVGGLAHLMLPTSELNLQRAEASPATFVDTGVVALVKACSLLGARRAQLIITAVGGAAHSDGATRDQFQIGRRNFEALGKALLGEGLLLRARDVGGQFSRNMSLHIDTGEVQVSRFENTSLRALS